MERIPITRKGYEALKAELERIKKVDRPANIIAIEEARAHGDLSENAEYHSAKDAQGLNEAKVAELEDEQAELSTRIEQARDELQAFRETHDIVSLERGENRSLSSLKGLNDSLNKARERLIETQARKAAVDAANAPAARP